ncbi:sugar ABC transporter permease, partial [Lactobacillus sp. XV13L]|nr:sugar ABC transporter permease [Lactobacillus sp. XV13L]
VKGLALLITELVFIAWFVFSGVSAISIMTNLGPIKNKKVVYDSAQGVYITKQPSNSVLILLFGLLAIIFCIALAYLYIVNLRSTRKNYVLKRDGKHILTNKEELASLFDARLHDTLMTVPIIGILSFTVLPTIFMISMAFTNYDRNHPIAFSWTGFQAFGNVISGDLSGTFFPVLGWTLVWAVAATVTT